MNSGVFSQAVKVRCMRDPDAPDRTCFVRVLQQDEGVLGVSGNGCEDYDGSNACAACIKETQKMVRNGEV